MPRLCGESEENFTCHAPIHLPDKEAGRFVWKSIRPKWKMFRPTVKDVSPNVSESMKIDIAILIWTLIFFLSDLPSTLSGDRTYVAPQSYILK